MTILVIPGKNSQLTPQLLLKQALMQTHHKLKYLLFALMVVREVQVGISIWFV